MGARRSDLRAVVVALALSLLVVVGCGSSGGTSGGAEEASAATDATTTTTVEVGPKPSAGCGTSAQGPEEEREHLLQVDGTSRRYLLTVPAAHDGTTPLPVVFDFHGLLEGADIHTQMSGSSAVAEEQGYVVVFPHGTGTPLRWDLHLGEANGDLHYFDAVLDEVSSALCLDESRVYATGLSMGAMFTSVLLCERADVLAAAVPVSGLLDLNGCAPSRPVPILAFHGTEDPILQFNGGIDISGIDLDGAGEDLASPTTTAPPADLDGPGYPANVAAWAARNGCDPEASDTEVSDEVVHRAYDCPPGADVEFDIIVGGGHAWPGSGFSRNVESVVGHTTFDVDATRDGWAFMRQFTNPGNA